LLSIVFKQSCHKPRHNTFGIVANALNVESLPGKEIMGEMKLNIN